jgi:N6-adenosine-specific RNA methylase IME4
MSQTCQSRASDPARQAFPATEKSADIANAASAQALTLIEPAASGLLLYERANASLAEAIAVDEILQIRDEARMVAACARVAENRELEGNAVALRLRATRRLGQLMQAQKDTLGLNCGAAGGGKKDGSRGLLINPRDLRPTLGSQGIGKNLAQQARVLGGMADAAFEDKVVEARGSVARVFRRAVREVEIGLEREERRARSSQGGSVADLHKLIASGFRAGTIASDPAWPFEQYSERAAHALTDHYDIMPLDEIKALPVGQLAADDCALFLWVTWPKMPIWHEVIEAWGFRYSGLGFDWVKLNADGEGLHWGNGYNTRQNPEPCLIAKRGSPLRLDANVHSVIMTPVGAHSEKPDEAYRRMKQLYGGPYLELFAREPREGWLCWGNELPAPAIDGDAS